MAPAHTEGCCIIENESPHSLPDGVILYFGMESEVPGEEGLDAYSPSQEWPPCFATQQGARLGPAWATTQSPLEGPPTQGAGLEQCCQARTCFRESMC